MSACTNGANGCSCGRGAPTVAVQGELGWLGVHCIRLLRLASLWARLIRLSGKCLAGRIADFANVQSSFIYAAANELVCMGVAHPATWGIGPRTASSVVNRFHITPAPFPCLLAVLGTSSVWASLFQRWSRSMSFQYGIRAMPVLCRWPRHFKPCIVRM